MWREVRPSLRYRPPAPSEGSECTGDAECRESNCNRSFSGDHSHEEANRASRAGSKQSSSGSLTEWTHAAEARRGCPECCTNRDANKRTVYECVQTWIVAATAIMRKKLITNGSADEKSNHSSPDCRHETNRKCGRPRIQGCARTDRADF